MPGTRTPIVYLDQKNWIELARGHYGRDSRFTAISEKVVQVASSGKAIFPLYVTHFDETLRNLNDKRRERLATYMVLVSKGWALIPIHNMIDWEIESACIRHQGGNGYNLDKYAVKKGLSQLFGQKAYVQVPTGYPNAEAVKKKLADVVESPDTLLFLMKRGAGKPLVKHMLRASKTTAQEMEKIRLSQTKIKDRRIRRKVAIAQYFVSAQLPKMKEFLETRLHWDLDSFLATLKDEAAVLNFFRAMPTSYCNAELTFYRDEQTQRKVQPNDLNDIMSLSVAIPYAEAVVTERMWQAAIKLTKLDKLRPAKIFKSATDLEPFLTTF